MDGSVQLHTAVPSPVRGDGIESFLGFPIPSEIELGGPDQISFLGTEEMQRLMLERPPFFFIERAVAIGQHTVLGVATMTEERCSGHFPGRPIVPLIELCKAMAQTGLILASLNAKSEKLAPIAISSGPSQAIAKDLIEAPTRILIRVEIEEVLKPGMRFMVKGKTFTASEPIGTLTKIEYMLLPKSRLVRPKMLAVV